MENKNSNQQEIKQDSSINKNDVQTPKKQRIEINLGNCTDIDKLKKKIPASLFGEGEQSMYRYD